MKISKEKINHIANLSRIYLIEKQKALFSKQLSTILNYMDILNELDTTDIEPTSQVTGLLNVTRQDTIVEQLPEDKEKILNNYPDRVENFLKVPGVFQNKE